MADLIPVSLPQTSADPADLRVGHLLSRDLVSGVQPRAALIGFPADEGVRRNGGRPGAALGPDAIRRVFYRFTPDARMAPAFAALLRGTRDLGDVPVSGDLKRDQEALGRTLEPLLRGGVFVMVLGGGHETAFGHFLGYAAAGKSVEMLNWDAHPDVRPLKGGLGHSGSPFRQALEHPGGSCRRYAVAGLAAHAAAAEHVALVRRGGRALFAEDLTGTLIRELFATLSAPALVSFDLDAVTQSEAPGVSAPNPAGLDTATWLDIAEQTGRCAAVTSCDVVELCPPHDSDGRTARLAALTVWRILRGFASRTS